MLAYRKNLKKKYEKVENTIKSKISSELYNET